MRVLRPGGRLIIADPDHDAVAINTPFPDITRRFLAFRSGTLKNGGGAHRMPNWCREAGLIDVQVGVHRLVFLSYAQRAVAAPYLDEIHIAAEHDEVTLAEAVA